MNDGHGPKFPRDLRRLREIEMLHRCLKPIEERLAAIGYATEQIMLVIADVVMASSFSAVTTPGPCP